MKDELAELIGALKEEGIQKGHEEAGRIKADAKKEAAKIIGEARHEADRIIEDSKAKANATMDNLDQQMSLALRDMLLTAKSELEELVALRPLRQATGKALADPEFIKKLIFSIISHYMEKRTSQRTEELHIVIPEDMKSKFVKEWISMMRSELETQATLHAEKGLRGFKLFTEEGGGELVVDTNSMLEVMRPFVSERFHRLLDKGTIDLE